MTDEIGHNNNQIMEQGKDAPVALKPTPIEAVSKRTPNDPDNRCSKLVNHVEYYCTLLQNTRIPQLLCILTYITICLLGNIVTGVIYFKSQNKLNQQNTNAITSDNDPNITRNELNETNYLDASNFEYTEEYVGEEDLDLSQLLFLNDSSPVVSRKWTNRTNEGNF